MKTYTVLFFKRFPFDIWQELTVIVQKTHNKPKTQSLNPQTDQPSNHRKRRFDWYFAATHLVVCRTAWPTCSLVNCWKDLHVTWASALEFDRGTDSDEHTTQQQHNTCFSFNLSAVKPDYISSGPQADILSDCFGSFFTCHIPCCKVS